MRNASRSPDQPPPRGGPPGIELNPIWNAVVHEPTTGVAIVSHDGVTLWANPRAVRIFHGAEYTPEMIIGRRWSDFFPAEWIAERLALLQRIQETQQPILLRTIWRGFQHISWVHPIPGDDHEGVEQEPLPPRFLVITRRVEGDVFELAGRGSTADVRESDVANLGPLDVLSPRELEILALIGQGMSIKEIASILGRSVKTIENHRTSIGDKLKVDDRVHLAEIARRAGLTVLDAERRRVDADLR
jgi:DNA-binding CsgD family transcriptional regulator